MFFHMIYDMFDLRWIMLKDTSMIWW